jgi:phenylacetate-CoA ligase
VFRSVGGIREAQMVQERLDLVRVRVVPALGFDASHEHAIAMGVRERIGEVQVVVDRVDAIPRTTNGKLRVVVCNVSAQERLSAVCGSPQRMTITN